MGVYTTWACHTEKVALDGNKPLTMLERWHSERTGENLSEKTTEELCPIVRAWGESEAAMYSEYAHSVLEWLSLLPVDAIVTSYADADPWNCDTCGYVPQGWKETDIYSGSVLDVDGCGNSHKPWCNPEAQP